MEALQYYSYDIVRPAFFDIVLENKALRDKESLEMMTIIQIYLSFSATEVSN